MNHHHLNEICGQLEVVEDEVTRSLSSLGDLIVSERDPRAVRAISHLATALHFARDARDQSSRLPSKYREACAFLRGQHDRDFTAAAQHFNADSLSVTELAAEIYALTSTSKQATMPTIRAWERTDFSACIRDCFEHYEAIQALATTSLKKETEGDFMPHLARLGAYLAELRDRLAREIDWSEPAVGAMVSEGDQDASSAESAEPKESGVNWTPATPDAIVEAS